MVLGCGFRKGLPGRSGVGPWERRRSHASSAEAAAGGLRPLSGSGGGRGSLCVHFPDHRALKVQDKLNEVHLAGKSILSKKNLERAERCWHFIN